MISEGVIVAVVSTIIAPTIAWLLKRSNKNLEKIYESLNEIKEQVEITKDGTLAITKFRLLIELTEALNQGFIGINKLRELSDLHNSYEKLGGNSTISELFEKCQKLPLKKEDN